METEMETRDIVECIILNKNNEILLQKKTLDYKISPGTGHWCFFGGAIEPGEFPEDTVRRELKEELGIDFKEFTLFKVKPYTLLNRFCGNDHIFITRFLDDLSNIKLAEGAGFAFFSYEELKSIKFEPIDLETLKEFVSKGNLRGNPGTSGLLR